MREKVRVAWFFNGRRSAAAGSAAMKRLANPSLGRQFTRRRRGPGRRRSKALDEALAVLDHFEALPRTSDIRASGESMRRSPAA
jgi:hypothetical protein